MTPTSDIELERRLDRLVELGWGTDLTDTTVEGFEVMVHELAHNLILGDMTPKHMGDTNTLIRNAYQHMDRVDRWRQTDLDEILATAVTIQCCETHYGLLEATDISLQSVGSNVNDRELRANADQRAVELINTPRVVELAQQLHQYVEHVSAA